VQPPPHAGSGQSAPGIKRSSQPPGSRAARGWGGTHNTPYIRYGGPQEEARGVQVNPLNPLLGRAFSLVRAEFAGRRRDQLSLRGAARVHCHSGRPAAVAPKLEPTNVAESTLLHLPTLGAKRAGARQVGWVGSRGAPPCTCAGTAAGYAPAPASRSARRAGGAGISAPHSEVARSEPRTTDRFAP
jgi:hypothetical protein